ncbi:sensor domain-containing diguanylate cyclase [Cytobacillus firmus]|uniref:PAS:GGDEF domain-containing protein domain-containing protein n=1 Tax=Cytobacillus firmus DS1 TaxID=1307436 RepID=W7KVR9_CYTFI|nr:sensor domain-containing diguanylate cyclase [Cytobacillus firmus]EWG11555.1 PAS:GGDEF domain-containing protein domain-containing protein [Cytobacillus firmus DS1]
MKISTAFQAAAYTASATAFAVLNLTIIGEKQAQWIWTMLLAVSIVLIWTLCRKNDRLRQLNSDLEKSRIDAEKSKEALNSKIQDYENLLYSLDGAIFSIDLKKDQVYFSKGLEEMFGHEEKHPSRLRQYVHPNDMTRLDEFEKMLQEGQPGDIEYRVIQKDDMVKWVIQRSAPIMDNDGTVSKITGHIIDITERKQLELSLKQMAFNDDLTDLPNRKALDRHIGKALARSKRHGHPFGIMFIDLDWFKKVNDTMGHDAGDQLLKEVALRLGESVREEDMISRIGGDEFVVVFEGISKDEIERIAERIIKTAALPYLINGQEAQISVSIGVSLYPDDGESKETLLENADKAMYYAKNNGKNSCKVYTSDLNDITSNKVGFLEKWKNALQSSLFNFG